MHFKSAVTAALVFIGLSMASEATPLTYNLAGTFSGSLGSTNLMDAHFSWTITADTSQAQHFPSMVFVMPVITSTIIIDTIGMVTTSGPYDVEGAPVVARFGFVKDTNFLGVIFGAPNLHTYDGLSPLVTQPVVFEQTGPISTDHGDWLIDSTPSGALEFTVTAGTVPEPITLALFGAGLAGVGVMRHRRKALD